jgi:hypothetical protein
MILYALQCDAGHAFEAWFRDSASFDEQREAGVLRCPMCDSAAVSKAIMAPRLARHHGARDPAPVPDAAPVPEPESPSDQPTPTAATPPAPSMAAPDSPPSADDIRRALDTLRRVVETTCDDVGPRFAEEARRIHYGEAPARGIFGRTSDDEADALREEGIQFASVPWPRRGDA